MVKDILLRSFFRIDFIAIEYINCLREARFELQMEDFL